jgi:NAD(P)-dependent dehydrogenase (short-subunit alcohol dehydrogenase family)
MELGLSGKVIVVTGASDGLGLALGRRLVAEGAAVVACARDQRRLEAAVTTMAGTDGQVLAVPADVSVPDDLARLVSATEDRFGRLDGVVNNAGRHAAAPLADSDDDLWRGDLDLKLMGAVRLTRLALPLLSRRGGAVVNTLATAGKAPGAGSTPTAVSRAAGLAFTKAMSKELGPRGVRVNAVVIGLLKSGQWVRRAQAAGVTEDELYATMARDSAIPLGRVGEADDFADLAAFLLSDRAAYLSGAAINLDGGLCPVA